MQTDIEKLQEQNTSLQARNAWLTNVNNKLCTMIGNAADILEEYEKQVDLIRVELNKTKQVYSKLHKDLQEALNEHPNKHHVRLYESGPRNADA